MLYHLTAPDAWAASQQTGVYTAPSLATEGFIHLSTADQWPITRARFFADQAAVVLLTIDPERLTAQVRWEDSYGHGIFPHLYGVLNLDAVVCAERL